MNEKIKAIQSKIEKINKEMYKNEKAEMEKKTKQMVKDSEESLIVMTEKESLVNCSPIRALELMGNAIKTIQERCALNKEQVVELLDISDKEYELTDEVMKEWMEEIKERIRG